MPKDTVLKDNRTAVHRQPDFAPEWISHSRPSTGEEELAAVQEVLQSGFLARGPWTRQFEQSVGGYLNKPHARAVASGTVALQLALLALAPDEVRTDAVRLHQWFSDKKVLIPAYACAAILYAVEWVGAQPVLVDVDPETCCLNPEEAHKAADEKTLAAVIANLFGHPGQKKLPEAGFAWIEDIAQAIGAEKNGRPVGSEAPLAVCSFYATKVLTTGTGGMVLTSTPEMGARMENILQYDNHSDPFLHCSWEMGDLQGAVGQKQWEKLPEKIKQRRKIAEIYTDALRNHPQVKALPVSENSEDGLVPGHIYFRYTIQLKDSSERFMDQMKEFNIEVKRPVFTPIYQLTGDDPSKYPATEKIFSSTVSLPVYPQLSFEQAHRVAMSAIDVLNAM